MAAPVMPDGFVVTGWYRMNKQPRSYAKPGLPYVVEQPPPTSLQWGVKDAKGFWKRGPTGRIKLFRSPEAAARFAISLTGSGT